MKRVASGDLQDNCRPVKYAHSPFEQCLSVLDIALHLWTFLDFDTCQMLLDISPTTYETFYQCMCRRFTWCMSESMYERLPFTQTLGIRSLRIDGDLRILACFKHETDMSHIYHYASSMCERAIDLPAQIKSYHIVTRACQHLNVPKTLEKLVVDGKRVFCSDLQNSNIVDFVWSGGSFTTFTNNLPPNLRRLCISRSLGADLWTFQRARAPTISLDMLPATLQHVHLESKSAFEDVRYFPSSLQSLCLGGTRINISLQHFTGLSKLKLNSETSIQLQGNFTNTLKSLGLASRQGITALAELPEYLDKLYLCGTFTYGEHMYLRHARSVNLQSAEFNVRLRIFCEENTRLRICLLPCALESAHFFKCRALEELGADQFPDIYDWEFPCLERIRIYEKGTIYLKKQ